MAFGRVCRSLEPILRPAIAEALAASGRPGLDVEQALAACSLSAWRELSSARGLDMPGFSQWLVERARRGAQRTVRCPPAVQALHRSRFRPEGAEFDPRPSSQVLEFATALEFPYGQLLKLRVFGRRTFQEIAEGLALPWTDAETRQHYLHALLRLHQVRLAVARAKTERLNGALRPLTPTSSADLSRI